MAVFGQGGPDRSTGQSVETSRCLRVVRVPVRDQYDVHPSGRSKLGQVLLILGSRVHHCDAAGTGRTDDVGVGAVQAHRPRVGGQPETGQLAAALQGRAAATR